MIEHNLVLHENSVVTPCPKCKNNSDFHAKADEIFTDQYEIYLVCVCGYDPTYRLGAGYRYQNEPGEPEETSIEEALKTWNQAVVDAGLMEVRKKKAAVRRAASPPPSPEMMIVQREQDTLAQALQEKYREDGVEYSYFDALDALIWMAKGTPEKFMEILPDLRLRAEKRITFDIELVDE